MAIAELLALARDAGTVSMLIMVLWGGWRKIWVWGWLYREAIRERDAWKRIALEGHVNQERLLEMVKRE